MLQKRILKAIKISLKKKNRKCQYAHERYRYLFIENEPGEEEKIKKHQYACKQ